MTVQANAACSRRHPEGGTRKPTEDLPLSGIATSLIFKPNARRLLPARANVPGDRNIRPAYGEGEGRVCCGTSGKARVSPWSLHDDLERIENIRARDSGRYGEGIITSTPRVQQSPPVGLCRKIVWSGKKEWKWSERNQRVKKSYDPRAQKQCFLGTREEWLPIRGCFVTDVIRKKPH